ncbi:MAG: TrmH family RNA methyltransferase, partial [Owenweeksia sp.]
MLSKSAEKLLRKLRSRKYRWQYKMFVAEGPKVVPELLGSGLKPVHLFTSDREAFENTGFEVELIDTKQLQTISQLETAHTMLGVFEFPEFKTTPSKGVLVGDRIQDPGNLGTIVRTCDWFGINTLYLSKGSADAYNAKCIQSTMGSITRVQVLYDDEENIFKHLADRELWVADMEGEDLFKISSGESQWALVMGSESHGPSEFWKQKCTRLTIPR